MPVVINEFQVVAEPAAQSRQEEAPPREAGPPAPAGPVDAARTLRALHAAALRVWAH